MYLQDGACVGKSSASSAQHIVCCCSFSVCVGRMSLLVYEHQALLNIRAFGAMLLLSQNCMSPPPVLSANPAYLRRLPCTISRQKCFSRQGKLGGELVKFKAYLLAFSGVTDPHLLCHKRYFPCSLTLITLRRLLCAFKTAALPDECRGARARSMLLAALIYF